MNIRIISAGAGSGKTYRLTSELVDLLSKGVRPDGIIATTFTKKAAAELKERVRIRLLEKGMAEQADQISNALIGTVHSLGIKLLQRFAYESGVSPDVSVIDEADQQAMFNQSLAVVLTKERVEMMEALCDRLGLNKRAHYDWRKEVKMLTDVSRINGFSFEELEISKKRSIESFFQYLETPKDITLDATNTALTTLIDDTISAVNGNEDTTKKTQSLISYLKQIREEINIRGRLFWHHWVKIEKAEPGKLSKKDFQNIKEYVELHLAHPDFHKDIRQFVEQLFEIVVAAIKEYDSYKKRRGLIDYIDMEVHINRILDIPVIKNILREELDLLMVDEFQDTSPIQLSIFVKLSKLTNHSIWVGDAKQSIYGFRGAEPQLMKNIITYLGGIKKEDIQGFSWRSREDIVLATNALFTKAFSDQPKEQIALIPKRTKIANDVSLNKANEPIEIGDALIHWHFEVEDGGKRSPRKPWYENCVAIGLRESLEKGLKVLPKGEIEYRLAQPGDVAVLCRSNRSCQEMAEALSRQGFKVSIARSGLLQTTEAKLILACLKFILNRNDSLAIAEIMLLGVEMPLEAIIKNRTDFLKDRATTGHYGSWGKEISFIQQLESIRQNAQDLTSSEILNILLHELNLRDLIASWNNGQNRVDNVEAFRKLAVDYEGNCNRLHQASSLAGFLLWLKELEQSEKDHQAFSQSKDAVKVMTYHRSKGLEWPIVICFDLESPIKPKLWGVNLVNDTDSFDINNILANRWVRYWVNPYGDQLKNTKLESRIQNSETFSLARKEALMEDARLLYVGITRARDYLVFPTRSNPTKWLNRIWNDGDEDVPTLDSTTFESCWEWHGYWLPKHTETFIFPKELPDQELVDEKEQLFSIAPPDGKQDYLPANINLRQEIIFNELDISVVNPDYYHKSWDLPLGVEPYDLAKVIKAFIIADDVRLIEQDRIAVAEALISNYDIGPFVTPILLLDQSKHWETFLQKRFTIRRIIKKYPISYYYKDRLFETITDYILETPDCWMVIQNSGFYGEEKSQKKHIESLGDWVKLSDLALREALPESIKEFRYFIHFVIKGNLWEVTLRE